MTGIELRVFPLYYLPLSLAAWRLGRTWAMAAAALSAASWLVSNYTAGRTFSALGIWLFNFVAQGASFAFVGLLIARLKTSLAKERELSRTDSLTSLPNARSFHEQAARVLAVSRRKHLPLTLAYVDLDDFKVVNDTLGHHAGDEILRLVATVLSQSTRASDVTARLGGDEFAVLLAETGAPEAGEILGRLHARVAQALSGADAATTASIGGAVFLSAPESVDAMLRRADAYMYSAKAAGKNRVYCALASAPGPSPTTSPAPAAPGDGQ